MADPDDPPADEPRADEPRADEPRAVDVARAKSTADLGDRLDPGTVAQLAAWFGLPSFEELEEQRRATDAPALDEQDQARRDLHTRIAEVADPSIVARIEARTTAGDPLIRLPPPMEIKIGGEILASDPQWADHVGSAAEPREVEIPSWLEEDMRDCAPQAILRDLHRPELDFYMRFESLENAPSLQERAAAVREAITASIRVTLDTPPALQTIRDATADVRHWKAARWDELPLTKREPEPEPEDQGGPNRVPELDPEDQGGPNRVPDPEDFG